METGAKLVTITPEKAAAWLSTMDPINLKRRRESHIEEIARDIRDGRWTVTGDTIKFNSEGALFDGQHRLNAIIKTGQTVQSWVVFGIEDPNAFMVTDTNLLIRSTYQLLRMRGHENTRNLGAVGKRLLVWDRTPEDQRRRFSCTSEFFRMGVSQREVIAYSEEHQEEILEMVEAMSSSLPFKKCKAPSAMVTALIICNRVDDVLTHFFVEGLRSGANLAEKSSLMLLRERMIFPPERGGLKWETEIMALVIKSWNYFCSGKEMSNLRWRQEGDNPEYFPLPREQSR